MLERHAQIIQAAQKHVANLGGALNLLEEACADSQATPEVIQTLAKRVQEVLDQHDFTLKPVREHVRELMAKTK